MENFQSKFEPLNEVDPSPVPEDDDQNDKDGIIHPHHHSHWLYKHLPSILNVLQKINRYSSYAFSAFLGVHVVNTMVAPLWPSSDPLGTINDTFMVARELYLRRPFIEPLFIFGSAAAHVLTGIAMRVIRRVEERKYYGESLAHQYRRLRAENKGVAPAELHHHALSNVSMAGYMLIPLFGLHVYSTRILTHKLGSGGDTSIQYITQLLQKHKILGFGLYGSLVGIASFHIIGGWYKWMYAYHRKRVSRWIITGIAFLAWFASLIRIFKLDRATGSLAQEYDYLYRQIWSGF